MRNYALSVRTYMNSNGNTYYTMRITFRERKTLTVGDDLSYDMDSFVVPKTYGHGYATYVDKATEILGNYGEDIDTVRFVVDEVKVSRRKDLHNGGK